MDIHRIEGFYDKLILQDCNISLYMQMKYGFAMVWEMYGHNEFVIPMEEKKLYELFYRMYEDIRNTNIHLPYEYYEEINFKQFLFGLKTGVIRHHSIQFQSEESDDYVNIMATDSGINLFFQGPNMDHYKIIFNGSDSKYQDLNTPIFRLHTKLLGYVREQENERVRRLKLDGR